MPSAKKRGAGLERRPLVGIARERKTRADDAALCLRECPTLSQSRNWCSTRMTAPTRNAAPTGASGTRWKSGGFGSWRRPARTSRSGRTTTRATAPSPVPRSGRCTARSRGSPRRLPGSPTAATSWRGKRTVIATAGSRFGRFHPTTADPAVAPVSAGPQDASGWSAQKARGGATSARPSSTRSVTQWGPAACDGGPPSRTRVRRTRACSVIPADDGQKGRRVDVDPWPPRLRN